jgi:hypothetical protein
VTLGAEPPLHLALDASLDARPPEDDDDTEDEPPAPGP